LHLPLCFKGLSSIAEYELSVVGERFKEEDMMKGSMKKGVKIDSENGKMCYK
jgi:hypothetical protein